MIKFTINIEIQINYKRQFFGKKYESLRLLKDLKNHLISRSRELTNNRNKTKERFRILSKKKIDFLFNSINFGKNKNSHLNIFQLAFEVK